MERATTTSRSDRRSPRSIDISSTIQRDVPSPDVLAAGTDIAYSWGSQGRSVEFERTGFRRFIELVYDSCGGAPRSQRGNLADGGKVLNAGLFVQDEIDISPRLRAKAGARIDRGAYFAALHDPLAGRGGVNQTKAARPRSAYLLYRRTRLEMPNPAAKTGVEQRLQGFDTLPSRSGSGRRKRILLDLWR